MATAYGYNEDANGITNPFMRTLIQGSYFDGPISYYLSDEVGLRDAFDETDTVAGWVETGSDVVFRQALAEFSKVANLTFIEETDPDAAGLTWTENLVYNEDGSYGAYHYYPNDAGLGGAYNTAFVNLDTNVTGGYGLYTMLHEIGHGLGLEHTFEGGADGPFPGTGGGSGSPGDNNLSTGLYSVMAYVFQPGFANSGTNDTGYAATPMALDIAAIQLLYGANMTQATGDDVYLLPGSGDTQAWACIWDAGGIDTISAVNTDGGATIDLRAATLLNEEGGGGFLNWQDGSLGGSKVYGGFTIANGVTIENAIGGDFNDDITGNAADNVIEGGLGDDTINGREGSDTASYAGATSAVVVHLALQGAAQNTLAAGLDTLIDIENLIGSDFFDTLGSDAGDNMLDGGDGIDMASYIYASGRVVVSLASQGVAQNTRAGGIDTLISIETLQGSDYNDLLIGDGSSNRIYGRDGNDVLLGGSGGDFLFGGIGGDRMDGGLGADKMVGEAGNDVYYVDNANDQVIEIASEGEDTVWTTIDFTLGDNLENLQVRYGDLDGTGNGLDNKIVASGGSNTLLGLDGNDTLYGRNAADVLDGGAGNDRLFGGFGADTLTGGVGEDRFIYDEALDLGDRIGRADVITDFSSAEGDRINLVDVDADSVTGGNQDFAFVGTAAFSNTAGEMRYYFDGGQTIVEMDTDGDASGDLFLKLDGEIALAAFNFIGASNALPPPMTPMETDMMPRMEFFA